MNKKIGLIGEQLSANYLREKGYLILDRNYRSRLGELDIVAKKDNLIIFVEVKTRTSDMFGCPSEAVNYKKQQTIYKLSQQYIMIKNLYHDYWIYRFDVIEVKITDKKYKINHILNAF